MMADCLHLISCAWECLDNYFSPQLELQTFRGIQNCLKDSNTFLALASLAPLTT